MKSFLSYVPVFVVVLAMLLCHKCWYNYQIIAVWKRCCRV